MQAGFEVVAAVDWDAYASMTYMVNLGSYPIDIHYIDETDRERFEKAVQQEIKRKKSKEIVPMMVSGSGWISHHPEVPPVKNFWLGDIRKLSGRDILDVLGMEPGEIDAVFGGPPCQGFSTAGKQDVMDPRNSLVFDFARLVLEIQPKTMMFENVPGIVRMVTPEGLPVVDELCRILEDGGFGTMNTLKKSLLASSGAGAMLKGSKAEKGGVQKRGQASEESKQISLFD
jgi:DNA (cytosine-5)-methyltransferase 1